jgi:hypothetical protein
MESDLTERAQPADAIENVQIPKSHYIIKYAHTTYSEITAHNYLSLTNTVFNRESSSTEACTGVQSSEMHKN